MMNFKMIVVVIAVMIIMAGTIALQRQRINTLSDERDQALNFAAGDPEQLTYYKNKAEQETARAQLLDLSLSNMRELIHDERLSFVKQFEGVNKRVSNVEQAQQTTAQVVREWKLPLRDTFLLNIDSTLLPGKTFNYRDSLNVISGTIIGNEINPKIEITVPLQGVVYWERKKVLGLRIGKKKWFSDISSTNPYARVTRHELIRIKKR